MLISQHYQKPTIAKTLEMAEIYKELTSKGVHIDNLGIGQSPFPVPDLIQNSLKSHTNKSEYMNVAGLPKLRELIAQFYSQASTTISTKYSSEYIIITPGSKIVYQALQTVLDNTFIIPQPAWASYLTHAESLGKIPLTVHTTEETEWKLTPSNILDQIPIESLQDAFIILNNPNNPTGTTYTNQELKELANLFKTHNVTVIADEVYWMLKHSSKKTPPTSIATYLPDQTIIVSSISKHFSAGGWRLGYVILPPIQKYSKLNKALRSYASNTYSGVSAPIQYAVTDAYQDMLFPNSLIRKELNTINKILSYVSAKCYNILSTNAPKNITVIPSTGAYYLYIAFPNLPSNICPATTLLNDHNIMTISGEAFGTAKSTIRASYLNFNGKKLLIASKNGSLNQDYIDHVCSHTFNAFQSIANWANTVSKK